jgi:serine/threonine protein kinase
MPEPSPSPSRPASGIGDLALAAPWPARGVPEHQPMRCIGRGAYGEVWLARNALGALRAVKLVHRTRFDTDRPYEREFEGLRRYEPVSRLHPGLVQILQVGRDDVAGFFYCIMELADPAEDPEPGADADGGYVPKTLHRVLRRRGRLPFAECLDCGLQLVETLEFLHDHGLIHRDVKPSNIIFVQGRLKLGDPGLVTVRDEPASMVGTGDYVPPEGNGTVGADLFALGRVLYEVATGKPAGLCPDPPTDLGRHPDRDRFRNGTNWYCGRANRSPRGATPVPSRCTATCF